MPNIDTLTWVDGDTITAEKLQTMVQAIRDLRVDLPNIRIQDQRNDSVIGNLGNSLKIIAGTTITNTDVNAQIVRQDVRFDKNAFTPGNAPIVIAQLATTDRVRAFCTVSGLGGNSQHPSAAGFGLWVAHQIMPPNSEGQEQVLTLARPQIVFWLAIGY